MAAPVFIFGEAFSLPPSNISRNYIPESPRSDEPVTNHATIETLTGNALYSPQYFSTFPPYPTPSYVTYTYPSPYLAYADMPLQTPGPGMFTHSNSSSGVTTMPVNGADVRSTSSGPSDEMPWFKDELRVVVNVTGSADVNRPSERHVIVTEPLENRAIPIGTPWNMSSAGRWLETPRLDSRRAELLRSNMPVATYSPTILNIWTPEDYVRHTKLIEARYIEKTGTQFMFKDKRTVVTNKYNLAALRMRNQLQRTDCWWIVTDTKVLLDDMYFMLDLLKSDSTCRMRVPFEVLHDLTVMTQRSREPYMRIPARRLRQFIHDHVGINTPIICQGVLEAEDLSNHPLATDAVLNCCLQLSKIHYYVALITDDPARKERAKSIPITCFSTEEVRRLTKPSYDNCKTLGITITTKVQ